MTKEEFLGELDIILDLPEGTLKGDEILADVPEWDSLAVISFIALVDEKFSLVADGETLAQAKSISDLLAIVAAHTAG